MLNFATDDIEEHMMTLNEVNIDSEFLINVEHQLQTRIQLAIMMLLCGISHALYLLNLYCANRENIYDLYPIRERRRAELMSFLVHTECYRNFIRMSLHTFIQLCNKLRRTGIIKDNMRPTVEEQVVKFLHIVEHNVTNRTMQIHFHRSGDTVSCHFHSVLHAIIALHEEFLVEPSSTNVSTYIARLSKFYTFFKV